MSSIQIQKLERIFTASQRDMSIANQIYSEDTTAIILFTDTANRLYSWYNDSSYSYEMIASTGKKTKPEDKEVRFNDRFDSLMVSKESITNVKSKYVPISFEVIENNVNIVFCNRDINSTNSSARDYFLETRNDEYNLSNHVPVTININGSQSFRTSDYIKEQPTNLTGAMILNTQQKLKSHSVPNQTLKGYDSFGKLIKTINTKNSIYINEDIYRLASVMYYIAFPQFKMKPLKFVTTH